MLCIYFKKDKEDDILTSLLVCFDTFKCLIFFKLGKQTIHVVLIIYISYSLNIILILLHLVRFNWLKVTFFQCNMDFFFPFAWYLNISSFLLFIWFGKSCNKGSIPPHVCMSWYGIAFSCLDCISYWYVICFVFYFPVLDQIADSSYCILGPLYGGLILYFLAT